MSSTPGQIGRARTTYHSGFGPWGGRANYGGVGNPLATRTGRHRTAPTFMFGGLTGKPMRRLKTTKGLTQWHLKNGVVKTKVKCYDTCKHFALHHQHPDAETAGGVDTMANKVPFNRLSVEGWATDEPATECDGEGEVEESLPIFINTKTNATQGSPYTYRFATSDADAVTFAATTLPASGWLTFIPATGVLSGTPGNSDVGDHLVVITATDGAGATATDSFTITVANINDSPTITSAPDLNATQGSPYTYTVKATDVDDGDTVTFAATTLPASGWLTFIPATGVLSGTPSNSDVGDHPVVITATDGAGATAADSFTIIVA